MRMCAWDDPIEILLWTPSGYISGLWMHDAWKCMSRFWVHFASCSAFTFAMYVHGTIGPTSSATTSETVGSLTISEGLHLQDNSVPSQLFIFAAFEIYWNMYTYIKSQTYDAFSYIFFQRKLLHVSVIGEPPNGLSQAHIYEVLISVALMISTTSRVKHDLHSSSFHLLSRGSRKLY